MKFNATKRGGNTAITIHDSTGKHAGFIANATPTDTTHARIANDVVDLFRFMANGKPMAVGGVRMHFNAGHWVVIDDEELIETMNAADAFAVLCKRVKTKAVTQKSSTNKYDDLVDSLESIIES